MKNDLLKKVKNTIYSKPHKSFFNQFYNPSKNYDNKMLINIFDNNKQEFDKDKNIMISELDIKLNNSDSETKDKIDCHKQITSNKNEAKTEFKKQLTDNIIKFLQKNSENDNSFNDAIPKKNDIISKAKKALDLASISPNNKYFKTINININRNHNEKINGKNYFIKINRKLNANKKKPTINSSKNKKEFIIKEMKNKDFKSFIEKFNSNAFKKIKKNNILFNQPRKSLLFTSSKKQKNLHNFNNTDYKKIDYSNIKFNKNISLFKESIINKSSILRNSFKSSIAKSKTKKTFKHSKAHNQNFNQNHQILNSNSKPKYKLFLNRRQLFSKSKKHSITENNYNYNTAKNNSYKIYDMSTNSSNNLRKIIPNKYRNLTLKEIYVLKNNFNLNFPRNNYSTYFNTTFNKEQNRDYSTIVYEKKKLKSPLKNLKIHVKKNFNNIANKNPINIVNININRNNNFIMNINNDHFINTINNKKIMNSSSKIEGKIRKFFSFQNFLNVNDNYKKIILKRMNKEKHNKDKNNIIKK